VQITTTNQKGIALRSLPSRALPSGSKSILTREGSASNMEVASLGKEGFWSYAPNFDKPRLHELPLYGVLRNSPQVWASSHWSAKVPTGSPPSVARYISPPLYQIGDAPPGEPLGCPPFDVLANHPPRGFFERGQYRVQVRGRGSPNLEPCVRLRRQGERRLA
jgi:hypothetical protein